MAHDVFISYSSKDKNIADAVCSYLENKKIRCWIAPRDILPGQEWSGAIVEAIENSRILVLILSEGSNNSKQVLQEVERALSKGSLILPFRVEDVEPSKSLEYFIGKEHWLDAITNPLEKHIEKLSNVLINVLRVIGDNKYITQDDFIDLTENEEIGPNLIYFRGPRRIYNKWLRILSASAGIILSAFFFITIFVYLLNFLSITNVPFPLSGYAISVPITGLISSILLLLLGISPSFVDKKLKFPYFNIKGVKYPSLIILLIIFGIFGTTLLEESVFKNSNVAYSKNGIYFEYNMDKFTETRTLVNVIASIEDTESIGSSDILPTSFSVTRINGNNISFEDNYKSTYFSSSDKRNILSESKLIIDGKDAKEIDYEINSSSTLFKVRDIWLKDGGAIYVLEFYSPVDSFSEFESDFNNIIASFRIK